MEATDANIIDIWIKLATLIVAFGVAIWGIYKFADEKRKDRQELARQKYNDYLLDARDNIDFMNGFWLQKAGKSDEEILKYRLFVARVMWACEEVLVSYPGEDWRACIDEQLNFHRAFFQTPEFRNHMKTLDPILVEHLGDRGFVTSE